MSIISLQYHQHHSKVSPNTVWYNISSKQLSLPPIAAGSTKCSGNRFIQTHELWKQEDAIPKDHPKFSVRQLTDSLVCMSMCNDIRKTLANLPADIDYKIPSPDTTLPIRTAPRRLTGSAKLHGKSLLTMAAYKKAMSHPATSHHKQRRQQSTAELLQTVNKTMRLTPPGNPQPPQLDLRLSPVHFNNKSKAETTAVGMVQVPASNKKVAADFRLPYHECLTKSKSPTINVLEVECLTCGQLGSVYRHRADKANCGRCGSSLAIKLDNKLEFKFKVTKKYSSNEIRERLSKQDQRTRRGLGYTVKT